MGQYNILIGNSNIFNFTLLNKLVKEEGNIFVIVEDLMTFGQRYIENKYKELFGESLFDFNKNTYIISQNEIECLNICFKEVQNSNGVLWNCIGTIDYSESIQKKKEIYN